MHCAVQLSAFLYRAMYSTMQQPLTRTAALKKNDQQIVFWMIHRRVCNEYTHININKYNMNTLIFYNSEK